MKKKKDKLNGSINSPYNLTPKKPLQIKINYYLNSYEYRKEYNVIFKMKACVCAL